MKIDLGGTTDEPHTLVWTTLDDGCCEFVNGQWQSYTGLGIEEARDQKWQTTIHPNDLPSILDAWDAIVQSGITKEMKGRLRRSDGEYRWFTFQPSALSGSSGHRRQWCWVGLSADEAAGGENGWAPDGRLLHFLDMLPTQVVFLSPDGVPVFWNRELREYYGMSAEQLQQWSTSGAIHPDDHSEVYDHLNRLLTAGEVYDAQHRMLRSDGVYRWFRARAVPWHDNEGKITCYVSCQTDVHDLKQAEDLLAGEVRILEMVARGRPLFEVLDALSRLVEELSAGCFCSILIVANDRKHFRVGAGPSLPSAYNQILDGKTIDGGYGPCSLAVIEKVPIITADLANDPRWEGSVWPPLMKEYGYASCWSMPITSSSGEASGIFAIYRREALAPTQDEKKLIDRFTKIAGIAIERAQADEALRHSERGLRQAHAQLAEGQRLSKTGSFTSDLLLDKHEWSDEFYSIFELDPGTRPSVQAVRDRVHPADRDLFNREMARGTSGSDADFKFRIVTPSGTLKYLRGFARLIEHIDNRPIFMGSVQDITEAELAEAALTANETELRRTNRFLTIAQRLSKTGSFTWDSGTDQWQWSDEMARILGLSAETVSLNVATRDLIHADDLTTVKSLMERASNGQDVDGEFRIIVPGEGAKNLHVVAHPLDGTSDQPVFVGAVQDVTELRRGEEALSKARAELAHLVRVTTLNALTASITHEVSQPLSGILNNTNTCLRMLAADPPNIEGAADTARRTLRDTNRATEVIKRLRALFARKPTALEPLDLNDTTREVLALCSAELHRNRTALHMDLAEDLPTVAGDRIQLQQVILNLLLNAAESMAEVDDRPRSIFIETRPDGEANVRLSVKDIGIGIDEKTIENLFDTFYTSKANGMGVGLSVSRSIVESHKGHLWATANDGHGVTFSFSIPCLPGAATKP
jgi:PAS domain S-box-containing protein